MAGEAAYTALAGVVTKGVGSGFRVWDDRNAPWQVKKNTLQREAITLAQVSVYTYLIDLAMQKVLPKAADRIKGLASHDAQALLKKAANQKILLKAIPVSAGIFLAETMGRKIAPRNIWDEDGKLNDEIADAHEGTDHPKSERGETTEQASEKKTSGPKAKPLPLTFAQAPVSPNHLTSLTPPTPFSPSQPGNPFSQVSLTRPNFFSPN